MPFLVWNDRLSVGIEILDRDHRILVDMINELYDAVQQGHGKELVNDILDRLLLYTRQHFAREEALFREYKYPGALEHTCEHAMMTEWCETAQSGLRNGNLSAPALEVLNRVKDWLFDHIIGSDMRYKEYFHSKGIR